jgi:hypothetical protein
MLTQIKSTQYTEGNPKTAKFWIEYCHIGNLRKTPWVKRTLCKGTDIEIEIADRVSRFEN